MADIRPFCAVRPREDLAQDIAALPYDVYTRQEAEAEIKKSPLSFLRIDRAETNFPPSVDTYDPRVYTKAGELLNEMIANGSFVTDDKPMYYIYELTMDKRVQTGIVACSSVADYETGVIKKHENTREDKEIDRIHHVDACSAQTGPIFLGYRSNDVIREIVQQIKQQTPVYDFKSHDGVGHRVWLIDQERNIRRIREAFQGIDAIYICDGHHRCASAVKVGQMRREQNLNNTGEEEYNYFLSVLFPEDELKILDYNRVVKDLNGLSEDRFLDRVRKKFVVEKVGREKYRPLEKHHFGMYMSGNWYHLTVRPEVIMDDPVEGLDVSILQNELLAPILNIEDPRTDSRIDFVGGIHGLGALEKKVNSRQYAAAFALYPTDISELFSVADAGRLMPPKSTWFEPKLRSGLFIHRF